MAYNDGQYILYVNAEVDDGSDIAQLMKYFKTTDPNDASQGALSKRIHFLKCEEGGQGEMSEITEKWFKEGEMKKARETAYELYDEDGFSFEKIAKRVKVSLETVQQWFAERPSVAK